MYLHTLLSLIALVDSATADTIDRRPIVSRYNPVRNASSTSTPMQVGNGYFAFGADITGMQTFQPFAIMSSWAWKNDSLPAGKTMQDVENYRGALWDNHGRLVQYNFGGADTQIQQWLISNPNRVNLGRIGLLFKGENAEVLNVTEADIADARQELDLWTGTLTSQFSFKGTSVQVNTTAGQDSDSVYFTVSSDLLSTNSLAVFLDFPWSDGKSKFSAPFVGTYNATSNHTTELDDANNQIAHTIGDSTFYTYLNGDVFDISRDSISAHHYTITPEVVSNQTTFAIGITFSLDDSFNAIPSPDVAISASTEAWNSYWSESGFVDVVSGSTDERADELQRRIILSRYLMRVNEAGDSPPQESGLVNNGWYGKFHMEMYFWHAAHWALWNNWDLLDRSSHIYSQFLPTALIRAQDEQGWSSGARWPKMTDPSGRSAPGQINELLLWEQPHPLLFAQYEYRAHPTEDTLRKWEEVVRETANWMASFAFHNESTSLYDLGPPAYVVSEDTQPNATINPAFELAYWRLGIDIAEKWMVALGEEVPSNWTIVKENLAPLPESNGTYDVYEGLKFWTDPGYLNDHPALTGLYGWLPETPGLDPSIAKATSEKVWTTWNITNCWGWDFPMLAMSAARIREPEQAIGWLLDSRFNFDDVGMPIGGVRVPTPYFPGSGGLLYAVAFMAAGWDGSEGEAPGFPSEGWKVTAEGLSQAL